MGVNEAASEDVWSDLDENKLFCSDPESDDESDCGEGLFDHEAMDAVDEYEYVESVSSDEEDEVAEQPPAPLVAGCPQVLEPCILIQKIPGRTEVKSHGFRLCGDNLDKTIRRRFMRSDKCNISLHYFHSYAVLNRVDFSHLPDAIPDNSNITDLKNVAISLQPTQCDEKLLQRNIATLISRVLCTKMDFFKVCFEELVDWHIEHNYMLEMSQKSVVVSFFSRLCV